MVDQKTDFNGIHLFDHNFRNDRNHFWSALYYGVNALLDSIGPVDMFLNPSVSIGVVAAALLVLVICRLIGRFIPAQSAIKVKPMMLLEQNS